MEPRLVLLIRKHWRWVELEKESLRLASLRPELVSGRLGQALRELVRARTQSAPVRSVTVHAQTCGDSIPEYASPARGQDLIASEPVRMIVTDDSPARLGHHRQGQPVWP